ncbi:MAG: NAD(P)H-dependent oxidoreductase [Aquabacterium sp.]
MSQRILIIQAHPGTERFGHALSQAYAEGAQQTGHEVRLLPLNTLSFDPLLRQGYAQEQPLEPDLQRAQADILWAQEVVWVFPIWWGGMPALLKGFLDRTLQPGFAFRYEPGGKGLQALLKGRTAKAIITMDTPRWIDRWIYGSPALRQLKLPILRFCGIKLTHTMYCAPIIQSTPEQRAKWLASVKQLAKQS